MSDSSLGISADDVWSTPSNAPLVPRFPINYTDVRILTVAYRTEPSAIRRLLPAALEATSDVVVAHLYDMPDVQHMGAVNECNIMVGARLVERPAVSGGFTTGLYISSDVGLAQGREIHGQPKKLGKTRITSHGDLMIGTVKRNGIRILRATTPYKNDSGSLETALSHFDFRTNLNLKIIRNIDGTPGISQITSRRLENIRVHEMWRGRVTVELQANAQAPVHDLPVVESLDAHYWRADFTLVNGVIELDLARAEETA